MFFSLQYLIFLTFLDKNILKSGDNSRVCYKRFFYGWNIFFF